MFQSSFLMMPCSISWRFFSCLNMLEMKRWNVLSIFQNGEFALSFLSLTYLINHILSEIGFERSNNRFSAFKSLTKVKLNDSEYILLILLVNHNPNNGDKCLKFSFKSTARFHTNFSTKVQNYYNLKIPRQFKNSSINSKIW